MKKTVFALLLAIVLSSCGRNEDPANTQHASATSQEELIKRGKYLVAIGGCNDCHSPKVMTEHGPEPDPNRLLSGHPSNEPMAPLTGSSDWILFSQGLTAYVGPWGVSYAANLTPDETGIGNWSYEQFTRAIREGKFKGLEGGRPLLPPMPWQMYNIMEEEDLQAVFAYLKSIPAVKNTVPAPVAPPQLKDLAINK
jgi:mono/diheme cytochrome c family protein